MPTPDRPHPLAGYDEFARHYGADRRWPSGEPAASDPGPQTVELLGELLAEIRGLRADMKAARWRAGHGVPNLGAPEPLGITRAGADHA